MSDKLKTALVLLFLALCFAFVGEMDYRDEMETACIPQSGQTMICKREEDGRLTRIKMTNTGFARTAVAARLNDL